MFIFVHLEREVGISFSPERGHQTAVPRSLPPAQVTDVPTPARHSVALKVARRAPGLGACAGTGVTAAQGRPSHSLPAGSTAGFRVSHSWH